MSSAPPTRAAPDPGSDGDRGAAFAQLRKLLLGPEQAGLEELRRRLDDPELRSEELSQVIAEALALRARRDHGLQLALNPVVEEAVRVSVARNPAILADTLFPIVGEAVRKAVAHALRGMIESLNQVLERSVSWEAMMWRVEALRTGKSFGEVALTRSLRYRVEQVFLIHRHTGLLLCHVARADQEVQDADMVSGMFSTLQDFAHDSFTASAGQDLETIELGNYNVWMQHGPEALLAAMVTGTPPPELRTLLQKTLEQVHQELGPAMAVYSGDTATVEAARPLLEACLLGQQGKAVKAAPRRWIVVVAAVVLAIGFFVWQSIRERQRWNALVTDLRSQPGIVLTAADRSWGSYRLTGLRDPLSVDPGTLVGASGLDPEKVTARWEPYVSLDPKFAESRRALQNKEDAERQVLRFPLNSAVLDVAQGIKLDQVASDLAVLHRFAVANHRSIIVEVDGHTDPTGTEDRNAQLSQHRAESVIQGLVDRGIRRALLKPVGVGSSQPMMPSGEYLSELNRRVTFRVIMAPGPQ